MFYPISNDIGGREVKHLTKISIFFILVFVISTAYAFAAFISNHVKPLPEPLYLMIMGVMLLVAGHFINQLFDD